MTRRLTSSSLAGTSRKLVAVGTPRLASMFATMRAAAPRRGSPGWSVAGAALGVASAAVAAGRADGPGAAVRPGGAASAEPLVVAGAVAAVDGGLAGADRLAAAAAGWWSISRL